MEYTIYTNFKIPNGHPCNACPVGGHLYILFEFGVDQFSFAEASMGGPFQEHDEFGTVARYIVCRLDQRL